MKGNERYKDLVSDSPNITGGAPAESQHVESQPHVIFLAVDVLKSTLGKKKITEIGISTLATSNLISRAPGDACVEWLKKIRTRNFRIREWSNLQETDLLLRYGDNFNKELGTSEWVSVHNAPKLIASCFGHAAPGLDSSVDVPVTTISSGVVPKTCNVIVVGHRVEKKIGDLRDIIGFDVTKLSNVTRAIDVLDMFRALQQNPKMRTLQSLLLELDKPIQTKPNPVSSFGWKSDVTPSKR